MNPSFFDFYLQDEAHFYERPYFAETLNNSDNPNYARALKKAKALIKVERPRLLDLGCGTGGLLRIAKKLGFEPEGLEVSETVSKVVAKEFPVHIYDGNHANFPKLPPFDAVAVWDVLEHLPDPVAFLKAVKPLLKPDGKLILRTINENCLLSQTALWIYRLSGGRIKAPAERMHELHHVIYYTPKTFRKLVRKAGYQEKDYWISEFPADRATTSKLVQLGLEMAYLLQRLAKRTYVHYIIATPETK